MCPTEIDESSGTTSNGPLSDKDYAWFSSNQPELIDLIDSRDLLYVLVEKGCISIKHFNRIKSLAGQANVNRALVDVISRRSRTDYDCFIEALKMTGQTPIANFLIKGAGIVSKLTHLCLS